MGLTQGIADLRWILLILFVVNQQSVIAAAETQKQTCHQAMARPPTRSWSSAEWQLSTRRWWIGGLRFSRRVRHIHVQLDYIHVHLHVVHVAINFVQRAQWRYQTYANHFLFKFQGKGNFSKLPLYSAYGYCKCTYLVLWQ